MKDLRYTFVTDGSSDKVLMPILTWTLIDQGVSGVIQPEWADLRNLASAGSIQLTEKIPLAIEHYPCDLLFVHRDAERESIESRKSEINNAIRMLEKTQSVPPRVCVVPVRMQEAWLLFDENAIRLATGNRSGRRTLNLPKLSQVEQVSNPKAILHNCLRQVSGLTGRRLKSFRANSCVHRITELISDFSPLRALKAFKAFENDLREIIIEQGWDKMK